MIFVFDDSGMLQVLEDLEAVQRECEALDVESGAFVFYADDGTWLRPRFTTPNRHRFLSHASGTYVLEREPTPPPEVDSIDVALDESVGIDPNAWFGSLDAVRAHIVSRRGGG